MIVPGNLLADRHQGALHHPDRIPRKFHLIQRERRQNAFPAPHRVVRQETQTLRLLKKPQRISGLLVDDTHRLPGNGIPQGIAGVHNSPHPAASFSPEETDLPAGFLPSCQRPKKLPDPKGPVVTDHREGKEKPCRSKRSRTVKVLFESA